MEKLDLNITPEPRRFPEGRYFVCHPGSSAQRGMDLKRLPPEVFADLIRRVHAALGLPAVLVGGPEEGHIRNAIQDLVPGACLNPVTWGLEQAAGVIARAEFFLGNDSGLMHMAAALGLPCLAFFGPTDDRRNGPVGGNHLILRRDLSCSPCWTAMNVGKRVECMHWDYRCLRAFTADEAWPAIRDHLQGMGYPKPEIPSTDWQWKHPGGGSQSGKGIPK